MANPTTNFGWVMPTSTDLVTDLPADFNVFGQGVDTSMQYLLGGTTGQVLSKTSGTNMAFTWVTPTDQTPLTTKGDLFAFSTVDARLAVGANETRLVADSVQATGLKYVADTTNYAINAKADLLVGTAADTLAALTVGTNGQVLTADSTVSPTGLKWATPTSGAMTFINRTTFSAVASQTFDSVFSSTYDTYLVVIERILGTTGSDDLQLQLRYGSTTQAAAYYGSTTTFTSGTVYQQSSNAAQFTMASLISKTGQTGSAVFYVNGVGNTSEQASIYGNGTEGETPGGAYIFGCWAGTAQTYTGFLLKPSAGTMTGEVSIYGLAKS